MLRHYLRKIFFSVYLLLFTSGLFAQLPFSLIDGREHRYCSSCTKVIQDMPKEVLFGVHINTNGDVYFSMSNKEWFDKILKNNSYGVTIDIVAKDKYSCNSSSAGNFSLPRGIMLEPVYKQDIVKNSNELAQGYIFSKVGKVPQKLLNKELEGNLVIVNGNYICFYTNFIDIDRSPWQLLPMGLFTDSLLQETKPDSLGRKDFFTWSKKIQTQVPFLKASAIFSDNYIHNLYDSLSLSKYHIRKIEIRAYSSVEGSEKINRSLMDRRAKAMLNVLRAYQPDLGTIKIVTAENWLEFFQDIQGTKYESFKNLSKIEIKQKLTDETISKDLEPLLAKHRKVVATLFLAERSVDIVIKEGTVIADFNAAVAAKNINRARTIQKELVEQVIDKSIPLEYFNKLEVPRSKDFSPLLNDREVYKYLLKATTEYEALDNFLELKKIDSENGRINYNICALRFFMWQYGGDTLAQKTLLKDIQSLPAQGISATLAKRMEINFHILKCEDQMHVYDYAGKESSLNTIRDIFNGLTLNDEDIYSLAKYYSFYSHMDWAKEIITPRIDKIDVSEDLVFYYVNLLFYSPSEYNSDAFKKASLNAINLDQKRFCDFFLPNGMGGASMQLLDYKEIKELYCSECK